MTAVIRPSQLFFFFFKRHCSGNPNILLETSGDGQFALRRLEPSPVCVCVFAHPRACVCLEEWKVIELVFLPTISSPTCQMRRKGREDQDGRRRRFLNLGSKISAASRAPGDMPTRVWVSACGALPTQRCPGPHSRCSFPPLSATRWPDFW